MTTAKTPLCRAPSTSMYLDQRGAVRACCMNELHKLGDVGTRSLREIWFGEPAERLRAAIADDDLGLGCHRCAVHVDRGHPELAYARAFDGLTPSAAAPDWPAQLELSLSNTCNLQCVMCNGEWSSAIRSHREGRPPLPRVYDDAFFEELAAFIPHLDSINLLGGEPFLAAEALRVLELVAELNPAVRVSLTTNGTVWTPRVQHILQRVEVDITVSLDAASAAVHERIRIGASWPKVRANLDRFAAHAEERGTHLAIAFCLMTVNWAELGPFCAFADELGCTAVVNTVTSPVDLSLFALPAEELAPVVAALDGFDAGALGRSRGVFDAERTRLHQHLATLSEPAPTEVPEAVSGDAVLELDLAGTVTTVSATDPYLKERFRGLEGTAGEDLADHIGDRFGGVEHYGTTVEPDGRIGYVFELTDGRMLRALVIPRLDGTGRLQATTIAYRWDSPTAVAPPRRPTG